MVSGEITRAFSPGPGRESEAQAGGQLDGGAGLLEVEGCLHTAHTFLLTTSRQASSLALKARGRGSGQGPAASALCARLILGK
jgi:hypothetical protein